MADPVDALQFPISVDRALGQLRKERDYERYVAQLIRQVLLTSPGEREQAEAIATAHNGIPMVGHDGDVLQLAAAISHCSVVVTNDSGPLHLATALAVPSVSIFGPTDPARTVIPGASRVLQKPFACQPCYKRDCPLKHHRCMSEIAVEDVFNAAIGLFNEIDGKVSECGASAPL